MCVMYMYMCISYPKIYYTNGYGTKVFILIPRENWPLQRLLVLQYLSSTSYIVEESIGDNFLLFRI